MIKLKHQKVREILNANVFNSISTLDELDKSIAAFGLSKGPSDSQEYSEAVGAAYEVYCEFFLRNYQNPLLGIQNVKDTSLNQFNPGFDFSFEDFSGNPGLIQTKWRSNPLYKFTSSDLGTFANKLRKQKILDKNAIIFTNLTHKKYKDSIFHSSWAEDADDIYRVIDRIAQNSFIQRDPKFFDELRASLELSREVKYVEMPTLRIHQVEVHRAVTSVLERPEGRANFIVATGGGKTLNEIKAIDDGFQFYGFQAQVFVAPTISLLLQHHNDFVKYGILQNISVKHIRTGDDAEDSDLIDDYGKTTSKSEIVQHLEKSKTLKTLFFVTYASLPKFIEAVRETDVKFDDSIFDEFHHAVKQGTQEDGKTDFKKILQDFPSNRMLFFSASVKRGRYLSADDEEIFGKKLADVTYAQLRKAGILVPKLEIRCVRLDVESHRFTSLSKQL
ncbi:MAG: DEAD/DEAH box helicase family protein, partial [Candidatus Nitrosotenuis sp.]